MMITKFRTGVATFIMMSAAVFAQSSSGVSTETRGQDKQTESKAKKSKATEKRRTTGKTAQDAKDERDRKNNREAETRDRANDPQMPRNDGTGLDPTRPGTPPTFPPNQSAPNSAVKPPDPTAPTTVKP
jgi:uncharacterized low-complexity protein